MRCSTRSRARSPRSSTASKQALPGPDRRRAAARGRPALQHRHRHPSRRDPGRGAQDLPAELPRVLRKAPFRVGRQRHREHDQARRPARCRSAPTCCSARPARCPSPSMSRSARTSGCRCRRRATPRSRAPRCWSTCRPATSPSARPRRAACCAAASRRAASRPTPTRRRARANRRPIWPGTAMPRSTSAATSSSNRRASRRNSTIVRADVDLGRIRQERLRNNGFADCAHAGGATRSRASARSTSCSTRRADSVALERAVERFPYVPSDPAKLRDNCYEAYNIQIQGLAQRLQSSRSRAGDHRRVGRPRFDAGADRHLPGDGPARPAAQERAGLHAAGLRHVGQNPQERLAADDGAGRDGGRDRHQAGGPARCWPTSAIPSPRARRSTTSPSRTCRRACAPTTCSAWPTSIAAWWSAPAISPSWGWAGAPTASAITCRTTIPTARSPRR